MTIPPILFPLSSSPLPPDKPEQWTTRKGKRFMAGLPPCPKIKPIQIRKLFGISQEIMANSIGMTLRNWQVLEQKNKPLAPHHAWACFALYTMTDNPNAIIGSPKTLLDRFKRDLKDI